MSGPIVRTGTTPKFWKNWDRIFGDDAGKADESTSTRKTARTSASKKKARKAGTKKRNKS